MVAAELRQLATEIDIHAPITSVGLDSVSVGALTVSIEQAFGVRVTAETVYEKQTLVAIAEFISGFTRKSGATSQSERHFSVAALESVFDRNPEPSDDRPRGLAFKRLWSESNQRFLDLQNAEQYFYEVPFSGHSERQSFIKGQPHIMLASFSYLGLVGHPEVNQAAIAATNRFGSACHGTRLVAGTLELHHQLEEQLAHFLDSEAAITFSSGFGTNVTTISTLVGPGDVVIGDEWNHASIVDGCKSSGAEFLWFHHNDIDELEQCLRKAGHRKTLVVVDAVYSMDGDIAPIPLILRLCKRYDALLMVDEAHSLGVLGATGRGIQEHFGLPADAIDVKMGTLSKTLASVGGYIAGSQSLITYLKHHARGYIFSAASPAPNVASALKALEILQREPERVARLRHNARYLQRGLERAGFRIGQSESAVIPLLCETDEQAFRLTALCRQHGIFVIPIIYPAVPMNAPRLRLCVMATHAESELDYAIHVLSGFGHDASPNAQNRSRLSENAGSSVEVRTNYSN